VYMECEFYFKRLYNIFKNKGFVNVGLSADTAVFAVAAVPNLRIKEDLDPRQR
jgi:hypothetical protein